MYPFFTNNIFQEKIFFFTILILFYNLVSFSFFFSRIIRITEPEM